MATAESRLSRSVALGDYVRMIWQRRWIVAAAVLFGWVIGVSTDIPERVIALVIAFIAGGVVLNVFKETAAWRAPRTHRSVRGGRRPLHSAAETSLTPTARSPRLHNDHNRAIYRHSSRASI